MKRAVGCMNGSWCAATVNRRTVQILWSRTGRAMGGLTGMKKIGQRRSKNSLDKDGVLVKGVCSEPIEKAEKFKTSTIKTEVVLGEYKLEYRVYKSKKEAELDRKKVKEQFG